MSERLVRELFPSIPGPEHTKQLAYNSYALKYIEQFGSKKLAIENLENQCKYCSVDDCPCINDKIIDSIHKMN